MAGLKLLSIEDDPKIADLICRVAQETGFQTHTVYGNAVVEAYKEFQPDVIVLDIMMPDMDGIEVLHYLRDQCCRAHVIILSGSDGLSRRIVEKMGNSLGFTIAASLTKPFRVPALRNLLEDASQTLLAAQQPQQDAG